jgi:hypothetical protein
MPRRRNSELSRELKRSAIEERRVARVIERELARQQRQVVIQEPRRRVIIQEPGRTSTCTGRTSGPRGTRPNIRAVRTT